ncbi:MAG TPA: 2Fe-2S iron-sulfur cluster-binding protein [Candidatus Angelobacter sp.]
MARSAVITASKPCIQRILRIARESMARGGTVDGEDLKAGKKCAASESRYNDLEARPIYPWEITRRAFVVTAGILTSGVVMGFPIRGSGATVAEVEESASVGTVPMQITINGKQHQLALDPRVTLLDLLREKLQLTGSKKGCDHGQCGACTVLANGRRINSCLSLAVTHDGEQITTVEGLAQGEQLHPVQAAFLEHDGFQCGYCTPGQLCSAVALLKEAQRGDASYVTADVRKTGAAELSAQEIRERMSGNICRCGAYPGIVAAVQKAAKNG